MKKIKIAIFGVGNLASYLIWAAYGDHVNLWHTNVAGHSKDDIEIAGVFDIDRRKVGRDLADVIEQEIGKRINAPKMTISGSILLEDLGREIKRTTDPVSVQEEELTDRLLAIRPNIIINLINSGLERTSKRLAEIALNVGASYINCTPTSVLENDELLHGFERKGLVIVGDDLQSQLGGTWLHRALLHSFKKWGGHVIKSYQLDVGGSRETLNTLDEKIREVKKSIKSKAVTHEDSTTEVVTGTTDYIPFLKDGRISNLYLEIEGPLGTTFVLDGEYKTFDGINGINTLLDVIRAVDGSIKMGMSGPIDKIINYGFKRSRNPVPMDKALDDFERVFINKKL